MKRILSIMAVIMILSALLAIPAGAQAQSTRYVVVFMDDAIPADAAQSVAAAGGELVKTFPQVGIGIAVSSNPNFANALLGTSSVYAVDAERFTALPATEAVSYEATEPDPAVDLYYYAYQWDIRRVKADQAWPVTSGSHDTVVAIIDTGIAWNHPDLMGNVVYHTCYSVLAPCTDYPSLHWHGTHVAGTVAAAFGGGRAVGVGPNLGLASYNVFELYQGGVFAFDEALWEAMLDVAARGYDVINMSLGDYLVFPNQQAAIWTAWNRVASYVTRMGVTIVASAGNGDENLNGNVAHIPSDLPDIISVGATGIRPDPFYPQEGAYDVRASYSNYGASVTVSAPGGDAGPEEPAYPFWWYYVFSDYVVPDPICAATASCLTGYAWATGTSMSSPHVAGTAGLVLDMHPELNPHQVTSVIKQTAEGLGDRQTFGHGMVDAFAAISK